MRPAEEQPRGRGSIEVGPLDVGWVACQISPSAPEHGVVDMKSKGHVLRHGDREAVIDDLARFGVVVVERDGAEDEGQPCLLPPVTPMVVTRSCTTAATLSFGVYTITLSKGIAGSGPPSNTWNAR